MIKLLTVITIIFLSTVAIAGDLTLDGKSYCRLAVSDGLFGQPAGLRDVCLSFSNGIAKDSNSTLGGNMPLSYPYSVDGNKIRFGHSEYILSLDQSALTTVSGSTRPGIIYVLHVTRMSDLHIPKSWQFGKVNQKSIATTEQLKILHKVVLLEIASKRSNEDSLEIINTNLSSLGLPEIQSNPQIDIVGNIEGFVGAVQGATIKDEKHLYCLPCTNGPNQYEFGITDSLLQAK